MTPVLVSGRGVTLFGGGTVAAEDAALALSLAPVAMAADGGADAAMALGVVPQAVVGDLDSLGATARAAIAPERLHRIAEQDSTDFDKCLRVLRAPFVLGVGFTGPRLDHALAAMATLLRCKTPPVILIGETDLILAAPPALTLDVPAGTRMSLMPFGPVRGTSTGLRWPLDGVHLSPLGRIGTSNEATGPVTLQLDGACLLMLPKPHLRTVLSGLGLTGVSAP